MVHLTVCVCVWIIQELCVTWKYINVVYCVWKIEAQSLDRACPSSIHNKYQIIVSINASLHCCCCWCVCLLFLTSHHRQRNGTKDVNKQIKHRVSDTRDRALWLIRLLAYSFALHSFKVRSQFCVCEIFFSWKIYCELSFDSNRFKSIEWEIGWRDLYLFASPKETRNVYINRAIHSN